MLDAVLKLFYAFGSNQISMSVPPATPLCVHIPASTPWAATTVSVRRATSLRMMGGPARGETNTPMTLVSRKGKGIMGNLRVSQLGTIVSIMAGNLSESQVSS